MLQDSFYLKLPFPIHDNYEKIFAWKLDDDPISEDESVVITVNSREGFKITILKGTVIYTPWLQDCIDEVQEDCEELEKMDAKSQHADRITDNSL